MRRFLLAVSLVWAILPLLAQETTVRFVENKGQWPDEVLFRADLPAGSFYLEADRFTLNFLDSEYLFRRHQEHIGEPISKPLEDFIRGHAYRVWFEGAQTPSCDKQGASKDYFNYFIGDDPSKWASFARAWDRMILRDLYPNTDLQVYGRGSNVKYDFVVKPGGNWQDIRLNYEGVDKLKIKKGRLHIQTSVNEIIEDKPFAYQMIDGQMTPVECAYQLDGNTLSFNVTGHVHPDYALVIDPELQFSTYSGSTADNFGFTATYDAQGFLYSGSSIFGNGYPTTVGAYQTTWAGGTGQGALVGTDIGITKYDTTGTFLVYSTYIGGSSDELPHSLIVNEAGELYLYGTTSSANYPTTAGSFQPTFAGGTAFTPSGIGVSYVNGCDIIVSRFNATGTALLGSTFIGGTANDGLNTSAALKFNYADEMRGEILFDNDGNVIIASSTLSNNFPVTPGAYQTTIGGGQDGCVVKLTPDLSTLLFGTYLGGMQADATYAVDVDSDNNIVVCGGTVSTNFPTTPGVISNSFAGGAADGYVSILSSDLSNLQHSTYYGTNQYDQLYFTELDSDNNVYVYGQTRGPAGALIENAAYNVNNGGMLVAKFEPDLSSVEWSTRFGSGTNSNPNLSPAAFLVDVCRKIYLSGWGGQTNVSSNPNTGFTTGLPTTPDAFQSTTDGSDFYIMVIEEDASAITYASFFGGPVSNEHVDGGTSRFDRSGRIYQSVCAGCGNNNDFPIFPPDAWSPTNNSNNCNNGVFKFDFALPITIAQFSATDVCLPDTPNISNQSTGATTLTWFVNGEEVATGTNPDLGLMEPGTYEVKLVAFNPETCNQADSVTQTIQIFPTLLLEPFEDLNLCEPEPIVLTANASGTATEFHWSTNPDFSDQLNTGPLDSTITVTPDQTTTYYIQVGNGFCETTESITVTPAPEIALELISDVGCDGDTLNLSVNNLTPAIGFDEISWLPTEGLVGPDGEENASFIAGGSYYVSVSVLTENNCLLTDSVLVEADALNLTLSQDTTICNEDQVATIAAFSPEAESITWSLNPDFSDPLNPDGENLLNVSPESTTTYYVQAVNGNCVRTGEVTVFVVSGSADLPPEFLICSGDTLEIEAINLLPDVELSFEWSPQEEIISGHSSSTITVSPNETTVYEALITTEDGCVFTQSTVVFVSDLLADGAAAIANPNVIPGGGTSEISAIPFNENFSYVWSPQDGLENPFAASTIASPEETTTYTVTIIDSGPWGECRSSASVTIQVYDFICGMPNIYLPNAFTPNGDGNNDVLFLRGDNIVNMHLAIYNRWGELVFETRDQSIGWDGTFRGKDVDPAVFVYHLEVDCGDGQSFFDKGNVTVIR